MKMMRTYKVNAVCYKENGKEYLEMIVYGGKERAEKVCAEMPKKENREYFVTEVETWD